jgi:hypothetical protein
MHKLYFLFIFCFSFFVGRSQNLTGLYTGTLFNDTTKLTQNYELSLKDDGKTITGTSYTTFILDDKYYFGLRTLKGSKKDGKLILEEETLLENNFPAAPPKGVRRMAVIPLNAEGEVELLNGMWQTNRTRQFAPVTGLINLRKDNDSLKSGLMAYLRERHPARYRNDAVAVVKQEPVREKPVIKSEVKEEKKTVAVINKPREEKKEDKAVAVATVNDADENWDVKIAPSKTSTVKQKETTAVKQKTNDVAVAEVKKETIKEKPAEVKTKTTTEVSEVKIKETASEIKTKVETNNDVAEVKGKKEKKKKDVVANIPAPKPFTERNTKVMQTVVVSADSLMLSLYDNGVVDGDVVSVYVNGVNVIQDQKLTASAFRKTIVAPKENSVFEIKLVAENLGSLPPNTGLMIIQDKEQKYYVNFSADMDTNASIIVRKE